MNRIFIANKKNVREKKGTILPISFSVFCLIYQCLVFVYSMRSYASFSVNHCERNINIVDTSCFYSRKCFYLDLRIKDVIFITFLHSLFAFELQTNNNIIRQTSSKRFLSVEALHVFELL